MYYLGDLNPSKQFYRQNLGVGLMYRYNVNARLTYRFNLLAGSVEAYDSDSKNEILKNRNLSFQSNIQELAGGIEFHYYKYQLGNTQYQQTNTPSFAVNRQSSYTQCSAVDIEGNHMTTEYDQYLSSDELLHLTLRGGGFSQMQQLEELGISFELDPYGCPLVLYDDVKELFIQKGIPLR